jgi:hypothetical protein
MGLTIAGLISPLCSMKYRIKKPFNPMLSETYEIVTGKFRCLSEKTEHSPRQIISSYLEGENYKFYNYTWTLPQF